MRLHGHSSVFAVVSHIRGRPAVRLSLTLLLCGICAIAIVARMDAQALSPEFLYQRDYSFERLTATRVVHDANDDGPIQLSTYVWRPLKNDRREVVLFSHGSTAGLSTSPREPGGTSVPRTNWSITAKLSSDASPIARGVSAIWSAELHFPA